MVQGAGKTFASPVAFKATILWLAAIVLLTSSYEEVVECKLVSSSNTRQQKLVAPEQQKTFNISADGSTFLKGGQPFRVVSGSIHYFRIPPADWEARLQLLKYAGLNTIQTYVAWNWHCPSLPKDIEWKETEVDTNEEGGQRAAVKRFSLNESDCDFASPSRNITRFFELAQQTGLNIILRPGPYICAEWDMGGLPAWLLTLNRTMFFRSSQDPLWMQAVRDWNRILLPRVAPWMYNHNYFKRDVAAARSGEGPIIMVQVENEYGGFVGPNGTKDLVYLDVVKDQLRSFLGSSVFLYSTDPIEPWAMNKSAAGIYQAVDFFYQGNYSGYGNVSNAWDIQTRHREEINKNQHPPYSPEHPLSPKGPHMTDEWYPGWITQWGAKKFSSRPTSYVVGKTNDILNSSLSGNSNINFYMYDGGSNFGFWPGYAVTQSYDYDAPIREDGLPHEPRFSGLREVYAQNGFQVPPESEFPWSSIPNTPAGYGEIPLHSYSTIGGQSKFWNENLKAESPSQLPPHLLHSSDQGSHFSIKKDVRKLTGGEQQPPPFLHFPPLPTMEDLGVYYEGYSGYTFNVSVTHAPGETLAEEITLRVVNSGVAQVFCEGNYVGTVTDGNSTVTYHLINNSTRSSSLTNTNNISCFILFNSLGRTNFWSQVVLKKESNDHDAKEQQYVPNLNNPVQGLTSPVVVSIRGKRSLEDHKGGKVSSRLTTTDSSSTTAITVTEYHLQCYNLSGASLNNKLHWTTGSPFVARTRRKDDEQERTTGLSSSQQSFPTVFKFKFRLPPVVPAPGMSSSGSSEKINSTYIDLRGWGRGFIVVNGFNLGRYWTTKGPQYSMFVPASLLLGGARERTTEEEEEEEEEEIVNEILVFEQERANIVQGDQVVLNLTSTSYNMY